MGNYCCQCCKGPETEQEVNSQDQDDETSPLLGNQPKPPSTAALGVSGTPPDVVVKQPRGSAPKAGTSKQHRKDHKAKDKDKGDGRKHLHVDERAPLNIDVCKVKKVDEDFATIINAYNKVLESVNKLRALRDSLIVESKVEPKTLDAVMGFIKGQLGDVEVKMHRAKSGDLVLEYDAGAGDKMKENMNMVQYSVELLNELEMVEKMDDNKTLTKALKVLQRSQDIELQVLQAQQGEEGPDYMRNCKHALKQTRLVSERWTMVMHEKDDLVKEFLAAFQHLLKEPTDLTRAIVRTKHEIKIEMENQVEASSEGGAVKTWLESREHPETKTLEESQDSPKEDDLIVIDEAKRQDETDGQKDETDGQKDETDGQKDETDGHKDKTDGQRDETDGQRDETDGQKDETDGQKDETDGQKDETDGQKDETDGQRDETDGQREETDGQRDETDGQKDETDGQKDETDGQKDETDGQKDETDGQKDETDGQKDETEQQKTEEQKGTAEEQKNVTEEQKVETQEQTDAAEEQAATDDKPESEQTDQDKEDKGDDGNETKDDGNEQKDDGNAKTEAQPEDSAEDSTKDDQSPLDEGVTPPGDESKEGQSQ